MSFNDSILLTFEISNKKMQNCLVDCGAHANGIPYADFYKLNMEPFKTKVEIVQLDHSRVKVIGELRNVSITLASIIRFIM